MAILRVNVRPAARVQVRHRWGWPSAEQFTKTDADHTHLSDFFPSSPDPDDNHHEYEQSQEPPVDAPIWQRIVWKLMPSTTVGRALVSATARLRDAGCATASLDAQVILAHVLVQERSWLFAHYNYTLSDDEAERYTELIARRVTSEPVAYIVGHKEFYGLDLEVDSRVLIPRWETELLVDTALDYLDTQSQRTLHVADIGTGSGAIALAIAASSPQAVVYAVDISADALAVASRNAHRLDERGQVRLLAGDLLAPLPRRMDMIVANLPYINSADYGGLDRDVRDYEPRLALEAGVDGLDAIRRLLKQIPDAVLPGAVVILEIGSDQGHAVCDLAAALLPQARDIELRQDYAGRDRIVIINFP